MLDPWIVDEILRKERERREEEERREQPTLEIEEYPERPEKDDRSDQGHEMPADRKPGYEKPDPNRPQREPERKKDVEESRRGVDISRITGGDDDDGGSITIDIRNLPKSVPEVPAGKTPAKKPD